MVRFNDFDIVAMRKTLCCQLKQLHGYIDTHAHVRREYDCGLGRRRCDGGLAGFIETGSANNHFDAMLGAVGQMLQRAFRAREIDQEISISQTFVEVRFNCHAGRLAQKGGGVGADAGRASDIKCARQLRIGVGVNGFDQHAAHATASAGHCNLHCVH